MAKPARAKHQVLIPLAMLLLVLGLTTDEFLEGGLPGDWVRGALLGGAAGLLLLALVLGVRARRG
ncbi:hypothetical protein [Phenylobacterium sp.]|jgi:hypothetical protein|uniref:hypothetical protein n=1 Tax=Phenylobacterium sp. TaxID=1871053 RepID=UPI002F9207FF